MKRFFLVVCLSSACTSGPKENTHQPAFDTLEGSFKGEYIPHNYSFKITRDGTVLFWKHRDIDTNYFQGQVASSVIRKLTTAIDSLYYYEADSASTGIVADAFTYNLWVHQANRTVRKARGYSNVASPSVVALAYSLTPLFDTLELKPTSKKFHFGSYVPIPPPPPAPLPNPR
ncbi:hypothetical protein [Siphonobacter sp. BAB-5405]|uniref:hypothetical protein n=1 Tax=Siphonobacter sp. BAB-5405 TaxID=1864825 RepID=UPI0011AEF9D8|nr:hypothetical protein [Siphonobacter sp. BAB-5405]